LGERELGGRERLVELDALDVELLRLDEQTLGVQGPAPDETRFGLDLGNAGGVVGRCGQVGDSLEVLLVELEVGIVAVVVVVAASSEARLCAFLWSRGEASESQN